MKYKHKLQARNKDLSHDSFTWKYLSIF